MNADHTVDDELQTRQAHTFVWQTGEVKGTIRVTDVHHDLQRQIRHGVNAGALHAKVEDLGIDVTGIAFGTGDGNVLIVLHAFGGVTAADHGRDAQLTSDDSRVTGTAATVGDNRRRLFHDRFPVRVGHVGDQHVARLDTVHFADVVDHLHRTCADAVTDSTAFSDDVALRMQRVTLHHLTAGTHGFRTRLDDKQFAGVAIFGPLDIHRTAIVLLNLHRLLRQLLHFGIGQREAVTLLLWHIFNPHLLAMLLGRRIDHADFFRTHGATHDCRTIRGQGWFVNVEFVRVDSTLHHHLAQTPGGGNKDHLIETRFGINREHHA